MRKLLRIMATALVSCTLLAGCSKISRENYDKVTVGMTPDEVTEVLGKPMDKTETEMPGLGVGKLEMWVYSSAGYGGKAIIVSFQGGKVSDKSWNE